MAAACADSFETTRRRIGLPQPVVSQQTTVLSLRIPQLCHSPALTVLKPPVGAAASPNQLEPQQTTVSLLRIPQLWPPIPGPPVLTVLKRPVGAVVCPCEFFPQQTSVSSLRIPQLWDAVYADGF